MLSNPIINNRYTLQVHLIICVLVGLAYAIVFGWGIHQPFAAIVMDVVISICLLFAEVVLLWNIFTYSIHNSLSTYQSVSLTVLYGIISVLLFTGVESLIQYMTFSDSFDLFVYSLPSRVFCLAILYCAYRLYYALNNGKEDTLEKEEGDEIPFFEKQTNTSPVNNTPIERITVKTGLKIKVIPVGDLIYLKAEDDYVMFVTSEGRWLKNDTLKEYETTLPSEKFVRVHRSFIVNIDKITKIERHGQKQLLQLTSGESLRISSNGYKTLREKLNL